MNRSMKRLMVISIAATGLIGWSAPADLNPKAGGTGSESVRSTDSEGVVGCQATIIGQGPKDWRRRSIVAGSVAVNRRPPPLSFMQRSPGATMVTKMGLMIVGHDAVRVSVLDASNRAWLYYGRKASSFAGPVKYKSVVFHPCEDRQRTVYPGGVRVKGHKAVRLNVSPKGEDFTHVLRLGKPKPMRVAGRTMAGWVIDR